MCDQRGCFSESVLALSLPSRRRRTPVLLRPLRSLIDAPPLPGYALAHFLEARLHHTTSSSPLTLSFRLPTSFSTSSLNPFPPSRTAEGEAVEASLLENKVWTELTVRTNAHLPLGLDAPLARLVDVRADRTLGRCLQALPGSHTLAMMLLQPAMTERRWTSSNARLALALTFHSSAFLQAKLALPLLSFLLLRCTAYCGRR